MSAAVILRDDGRRAFSPLELVLRHAVARVLDGNDDSGLYAIPLVDPLTAARFLRVANSPLFSRGRCVGSTSEAIDMMGHRASATIALISSFDYGFSSRRRDRRLESLRRHSLQAALLARHMAPCAGLAARAEELFIAGLLHDIAVMLRPTEGCASVAEEFHSESARRSAELLAAWQLPRFIVDAIAVLGRDPHGGVPPAPGAGHLLWVVHAFTHLVAEPGPTRRAPLCDLAMALHADPAQVREGLEKARAEFARIERCYQ